MTKPLRVAFYVRNRFQVLHLRPIFRAVEGAVWVVAALKDVDGFGITSERHEVVRFFLRRRLEQFDAVVSHAGPPRGKPLVRAKFIMVQYGAKLDVTSIEMAQRDALGFRVTQADEISGAIERAIAEGPRVSDALKVALFVIPPSVGDAFVAALGVIMARP